MKFIVIRVIFLVHHEEKDSPANKRDKSINDDEPLNPGKTINCSSLHKIDILHIIYFMCPSLLLDIDSVISLPSTQYKLLTFYEHTPATRDWILHFVVTKNNSSNIEVCKLLYHVLTVVVSVESSC